MIRNCNKTCEVNVKNENTDNCHFLIQEEGKTKNCHSKGKDKDGLTVVPLTGNRMQTRKSKSKRIILEKEVEISARRRREKKSLRTNGSKKPSGSLIVRDRCFIYFCT